MTGMRLPKRSWKRKSSRFKFFVCLKNVNIMFFKSQHILNEKSAIRIYSFGFYLPAFYYSSIRHLQCRIQIEGIFDPLAEWIFYIILNLLFWDLIQSDYKSFLSGFGIINPKQRDNKKGWRKKIVILNFERLLRQPLFYFKNNLILYSKIILLVNLSSSLWMITI